jgi:N6-L-threonylcarbamoyladenine synthase
MIKESIINEYDKKYSYYINDEEIGYIIYRVSYNTLDITDVFVKEEYRNKGYASELINYLINNNVNVKFMLEVRDDNVNAIKLYKKFGFKEINRRIKYYKDTDAIIMEKPRDVYILAIESSCDETSVSIVKNGTEDIATTINSQIDIHKQYGGVVPEIASRMHLENITMVIDETLKKSNFDINKIDAFAATYAPGLLGSLLVGLEASKTLSLIYNKPFIKVNHMMGHIYASKINNELKYPLIALIISGGHTDLVLINDESNFKYIGRTLDDAIGESFDKVARILDLPYPGGPNLEALAKEGNASYKMPDILNDESYNFSFSGIKSYVNNLVHNEHQRGSEINKNDLAHSFQKTVTNLLIKKTEKAIIDFNIKNFVVAGGVASNSYIRERLTEMSERLGINMKIPDKKYCTDNATMIASAAYILYNKGEFSGLDTNAKSIEELK